MHPGAGVRAPASPAVPSPSHKLHAGVSAAPRKRKKEAPPFAPSSFSYYLFPERRPLSPGFKQRLVLPIFVPHWPFQQGHPQPYLY